VLQPGHTVAKIQWTNEFERRKEKDRKIKKKDERKKD